MTELHRNIDPFRGLSVAEIIVILPERVAQEGGAVSYDAPPAGEQDFERLRTAAERLEEQGVLTVLLEYREIDRVTDMRLELTREGATMVAKRRKPEDAAAFGFGESFGENYGGAVNLPILRELLANTPFDPRIARSERLSVIADLDQVPPEVVAEFMAALDELHRVWGGGGLVIETQSSGRTAGAMEPA